MQLINFLLPLIVLQCFFGLDLTENRRTVERILQNPDYLIEIEKDSNMVINPSNYQWDFERRTLREHLSDPNDYFLTNERIGTFKNPDKGIIYGYLHIYTYHNFNSGFQIHFSFLIDSAYTNDRIKWKFWYIKVTDPKDWLKEEEREEILRDIKAKNKK